MIDVMVLHIAAVAIAAIGTASEGVERMIVSTGSDETAAAVTAPTAASVLVAQELWHALPERRRDANIDPVEHV